MLASEQDARTTLTVLNCQLPTTNSQSPIPNPQFPNIMFTTLISGISLLIFSTFATNYMSVMLLEEIQDIPGEENC
ncbi:MAG: hypothetical protein AAF630_18220 [Cyanobacteria bacterium P01_C01_bin.38]